MKEQRWKFGIGQTGRQELQEIREAQAAGRDREYMEVQRAARSPRRADAAQRARWALMIDAETERRRARHR